MEERKGTNTFYAIIGVATLVVAIVGATFAYFSAQATATGDKIQGGTNDDLANALSLIVNRVTFEETTGEESGGVTETNYNNLVPAVIDVTAEGIKKAVDSKCIANGYVGCHLYKIQAQSTQNVAAASIRLADLQTTATDIANWKYVLYSSADGDAATVTNIIDDSKNTDRSFSAYDADSASRVYTYSETAPSGFDMHNAKLDAATPVYYYLLIYLSNIEGVQNPTEKTDANSGTGTYTGVITMDAAGGKVVASFSTSG